MRSKVLYLTVTKHWFDEIANGDKKEDFREIKPYWEKRLLERDYVFVQVKNGYGNDRPAMLFRWNGYRVSDSIEETDLGYGRFFAIDLSRFIAHVGRVSFVEIADRDYQCNAMEWIKNANLVDFDLSIAELRLLAKACRHGDTIKKGERYRKVYLSGCGPNTRSIYRAAMDAHNFNMEVDMYKDSC